MADDLIGRCVACGFLSKFDRHYSGPPPYVYEMPPRDRETGERTGIRLEAAREIIAFPHCYLDVVDMWGEIDALKRKTNRHEPLTILEVISKSRECPKWEPYIQGLSPQHHLERVMLAETELRRQEFEFRMGRNQQEFVERLDKSNKRMQLILGIILGGIAVLEILVGVLQVLYPTGFPWLQNLLGIEPQGSPIFPPM